MKSCSGERSIRDGEAAAPGYISKWTKGGRSSSQEKGCWCPVFVHDGWSWCLEVLSLWIQNLPTSRENQRNWNDSQCEPKRDLFLKFENYFHLRVWLPERIEQSRRMASLGNYLVSPRTVLLRQDNYFINEKWAHSTSNNLVIICKFLKVVYCHLELSTPILC